MLSNRFTRKVLSSWLPLFIQALPKAAPSTWNGVKLIKVSIPSGDRQSLLEKEIEYLLDERRARQEAERRRNGA